MNVPELKQSLKVALKLRDSIASSVAGAKMVKGGTLISGVTDEQAELAQQLQIGLSLLQEMVLSTISQLVPVVSAQLYQRTIKVAIQLQNDLIAITKTELNQDAVENTIAYLKEIEQIQTFKSEQCKHNMDAEIVSQNVTNKLAVQLTEVEERTTHKDISPIQNVLSSQSYLFNVADESIASIEEKLLEDQESTVLDGTITSLENKVNATLKNDAGIAESIANSMVADILEQSILSHRDGIDWSLESQCDVEISSKLEEEIATINSKINVISPNNDQAIQIKTDLKDDINNESILDSISSESIDEKQHIKIDVPELFSVPDTKEKLILIEEFKADRFLLDPKEDTHADVAQDILKNQMESNSAVLIDMNLNEVGKNLEEPVSLDSNEKSQKGLENTQHIPSLKAAPLVTDPELEHLRDIQPNVEKSQVSDQDEGANAEHPSLLSTESHESKNDSEGPRYIQLENYEVISIDSRVKDSKETISDIDTNNIVLDTAPIVFEQVTLSKGIDSVDIKTLIAQKTELRCTGELIPEYFAICEHADKVLNIAHQNYGNSAII